MDKKPYEIGSDLELEVVDEMVNADERVIVTNRGTKITMEDLMHFIGWANQQQLADIITHAIFEARAAIIQRREFNEDLRESFKMGSSDMMNYVFGYIGEEEFQLLPDEELEKYEDNAHDYRIKFVKEVMGEARNMK